MSWANVASTVSIARGECPRFAAGLRSAPARLAFRALAVELAVGVAVDLPIPPPVRPNNLAPGRTFLEPVAAEA